MISWKDGMKISPGMIIKGMPNEVYHAEKGFLSSSQLKKPTPAHMFDETPQNDGIKAGIVLHEMMENREFVALDSYDARSKESIVEFCLKYGSKYHNPTTEMKLCDLKVLADIIKSEYSTGKTVIDKPMFDNCSAMVEAIKMHPVSGKLVEMEGQPEISFFWHDQQHKQNVKCRADKLIITDDEYLIVDWKTIGKPATDRNIRQALWGYGYDFSAAMYQEIVTSMLGRPGRFIFVFVESVFPCAEKVRVLELPQHDLDNAFGKYCSVMERVNSSGWRGYPIPESEIECFELTRGE